MAASTGPLILPVDRAVSRETRYDREIDMGDRYGRSIWEIGHHEISIGISIWDMCYRYGIQCINMVIHHIDMVILDIDMGDEANDRGDDSIDMVISHIDKGYLVSHSVRQLFAHSIPCTRADSPHPSTWPGHSFYDCLLIASQCTRAHSPCVSSRPGHS